jgi:hypothetical protein
VISCPTIIPAKGLEFSLFTSNFNHLADVSLTSSSWEAWTRLPEFEVVGREILSYVNILDQIHGIFSADLESVAIAAGDDSTLAGPGMPREGQPATWACSTPSPRALKVDTPGAGGAGLAFDEPGWRRYRAEAGRLLPPGPKRTAGPVYLLGPADANSARHLSGL